MTDKKWTPGPWEVYDCSGTQMEKSRYENGAFQVFSDDCDHHAVADCSCNHTCRMEDEIEANAHLIAAAPELYDALEVALVVLENMEAYGVGRLHAADQARAALAKARGEK